MTSSIVNINVGIFVTMKLEEVQKEVEKIKERNARVEKEKKWETSTTRRVFIAISTYVVMTLVMFSIGVETPFISAIIPTLGYVLSTLSFSIVKKWWMEK